MFINIFAWPLAVRQRDDSMGEFDLQMKSNHFIHPGAMRKYLRFNQKAIYTKCYKFLMEFTLINVLFSVCHQIYCCQQAKFIIAQEFCF